MRLLVRHLKHCKKVQDAAILLDSFVTEKLDAIDVAHIAAEVQGLGTYELQTYKSDKKDRVELESLRLLQRKMHKKLKPH